MPESNNICPECSQPIETKWLSCLHCSFRRMAAVIRTWTSALVVLSLVTGQASAIVTSDEFGSHVVTPGQPSFGVNTDGVVMIGWLPEGGEPVSTCTGALITNRHVLTAAHCFDEEGDGQVDPLLELFPHEIVFELADGLVAIEYELDTIRWPEAWPTSRGDLAVVTVIADAPTGVPRYPLYGAHDEVGQPFVMVGYGMPGHGSTGQGGESRPTKRVGLNRYDAIRDDYPGVDFLAYDFDSGLDENNALAIVGPESDLGFGPHEALSASGDSGGPCFKNGGIAAVTAFGDRLPEADVNDWTDNSWGEIGFDTRVSTFRDFIHAATEGSARFVIDGDYDQNGTVDDGDWLTWQQQFGASDFLSADGNGDGVVDAADYTVWRDNLGASVMLAENNSVPEPATVLPLLLATARRFKRD